MLKMGIETCNNSILALVTTDFNDNIFHTVLCLWLRQQCQKCIAILKLGCRTKLFRNKGTLDRGTIFRAATFRSAKVRKQKLLYGGVPFLN